VTGVTSAVATDACSVSSLAAGEELPGTATRAERWLLVETRGAWGRDVDETELAPAARAVATGFDGRVLLIRRPDRRAGPLLAFSVESAEDGGSIRRLRESGEGFVDEGEIPGPLVVVCCHGRRDRCCARNGPPVFDSLAASFDPDSLWQSSHLGGHRFAANVLVLPAGVLLGRVAPADAGRVAADVCAGRITLDRYRGRTMHAPEAQAADAAVRSGLGLTGLADVRVSADGDERIRLETPAGVVEATVGVEGGPPVVESCGKQPVASVRYSVRW